EMVFKALSTLSMRKVPKGLAAGAEEEKLPEELGTYKVRGQALGSDIGYAAASHSEAIRQRREDCMCQDGEVTPQFRSNYIYAGAPRPELEAVLSPDAGDRTERAKQLQPMVARHMIRPAEVQTSINPQTVWNSRSD
ncbi:unnamed protein product, partial [Symbiodinium microadriaticum]